MGGSNDPIDRVCQQYRYTVRSEHTDCNPGGCTYQCIALTSGINWLLIRMPHPGAMYLLQSVQPIFAYTKTGGHQRAVLFNPCWLIMRIQPAIQGMVQAIGNTALAAEKTVAKIGISR